MKVDLEKLRSIAIAPSATPSRGRGNESQETNARDRRWARDIDAYKRLRREGLQPVRVDGCAVAEKRAEHREQIEGACESPGQ